MSALPPAAAAVPLETLMRTGSGQLLRLKLLGTGPAVVLCHESPRSSAALLPLAHRLADRFTCVMLDSPGFGLSDPMLQTRPEIADFATVVLEAMAALELGRVPVYGTHTGAAIAAAAAVAAPEQVSAAVLDGYAIFTPSEQAEMLASYLPPFRPCPHGTHVAWLWARVRDQYTVFPWNQLADGARLRYGPPPLEAVQAVVEDLLLAGDAYRTGYAAAFRYDHLAALEQARVPMRLAAREDDLLFPNMERARSMGPPVTLTAMSSDRGAWGHTIAELLSAQSGGPAVDAATLLERSAGHQGACRILQTAAGPVLARIDGPGGGGPATKDAAPVVVLHDVPGDMTDLDHLAERLARTHRVIRLDLPGLGRLRRAGAVVAEVEALAWGVAGALEALGASTSPVVACGASLAVALRLGDRRLVALDPWPQVAGEAAAALPDLAPRWDGAHLMAAFWWARDHAVHKPWYRRENAHSPPIGAEPDVTRLHNRFRAAALSGTAGVEIARALYSAPAGPALAAAVQAGRAQLLLYGDDPDLAALREWAVAACGAAVPMHLVSRDPGAQAAALRAVLS